MILGSWRRFRYDRKCLFSCIYNPQITISPASLFSANFNGNRVKNHPKPWTCPLTSTETVRLIRDGEKGYGGGGRGRLLYLSLHCHHQNDSCIMMGSEESHFNVSLIVRDKVVTRQCPQTTIFEEKGEPKRIRTEVPLLTSLTSYARPNRLTRPFR